MMTMGGNWGRLVGGTMKNKIPRKSFHESIRGHCDMTFGLRMDTRKGQWGEREREREETSKLGVKFSWGRRRFVFWWVYGEIWNMLIPKQPLDGLLQFWSQWFIQNVMFGASFYFFTKTSSSFHFVAELVPPRLQLTLLRVSVYFSHVHPIPE